MPFLDEEDAVLTGSRPGHNDRSEPGLRPPQTRQQLMLRRLGAVALGLIVLVLLVFGVRGCLDARQDRAARDYVRSLQALTQESAQISKDFFSVIDDPGELTPLDFESEIKSNRGALETLVNRAEKLDAPDEMSEAQEAVVLTYELRRDAVRSIAGNIAKALGREGRKEAVSEIAGQMQALLASDVIYSQRAVPEIQRALKRREIDGVEVPRSRFLPSDGIEWLNPNRVGEALSAVRGTRQAATPGVHGMGLIEVIATPGDSRLDPSTPTALQADGTPTLQVKVQNQGESDETDVNVTVKLTGGSEPIELERSINKIAAGESQTVNIPISPSPPTGTDLEVEVEVVPVPGEKVTDNNKATYTVRYG